ncbi:MAG TPA: type IV toxin-antitoxin system AbiEi family antitoxin domain-containing protein [Solirubrobacteraceae bacterium]
MALAASHDNVITRHELLAVGLTPGIIRQRVAVGWLRRRHRGVYVLGPDPPSSRGKARAAVLACGPDVVASHRTAAELWDLVPACDRDAEVTALARNPGAYPGITIHRTKDLPRAEIRDLGGIPVTTVARTVCDVAAAEPVNDVEHALQEARVHHHLSDRQLLAVIDRAPTRRGAALIRRLLADDGGRGYTRSKAERLMRSRVRQAGLTQPAANRHILGYLVDFVWERERLIVEVDGVGTHGSRASFESDRERDQVLVAAGYRVIRITWRQLNEQPFAVIARLAQALASTL